MVRRAIAALFFIYFECFDNLSCAEKCLRTVMSSLSVMKERRPD